MKPEEGTYALIYECRSGTAQRVGQWGAMSLRHGYYIYVGSAFGPGGVKGRVTHHLRKSSKPHRHIDYLCGFLHPVTVCYTYDHRRLEHRWAEVFSEMDHLSSFQGFGCSDCNCRSHLFFAPKKPQSSLFFGALPGAIEIASLTHVS